ncbi:hypothetical protein C0993_011008 [Termitomyces sp. T159_Od127]|nr:hypothetical protein C0993_011008 [Termitomyces sp. T159_Od127]
MPHTPQMRSNKLTHVQTAAAHTLHSAHLGLDARVLRLSRLHGERLDMRDIKPNYGVHLQVTAHIKAKKANTLCEAAIAVARLTNHRNPHELEGEDHAAQSAKLQELIRRGTPRDLVATQELMKTLSSANPDAKPDYRTQALTELSKLEQKGHLVEQDAR